jgi:endonuclease G, mitochondrial
MFRAACILIFLSVLCVPSLARADACGSIFVGQQPPALINTDLAQRTTLLCNDAYASLASGLSRGPLWSAEHLTADGLARAHGVARQGEFHEEERLPPDDRATLSDYVRAGYDRGHMAPSGDMPDLVAQQQSFSLANVVPQAGVLNRHVWEGIESAVRHLAEAHGALYVVTGPIFQGGRLKSLKGRVLVPTATWKAVYDPGAGGAAAYRCTNVTRPRCTTVSIVALERETGIDPFPAVPAVIKQTAMQLPRPEPSRYGNKRRPKHHSLSAPLFR